jgi:Ca-activated chloride channel homolog
MTRSATRSLPRCLLLLAASAPALYPQTPSVPGFRATAQLVLVPVTVLDRSGRTVSGLRAEDFRIFEDRRSQQIVSFSSDEAACSVGLVLDVSGSMRNSLAQVGQAARALLESSNPEDEFFLLTVSTRPVPLSKLTTDVATLVNQVQFAQTGGWTALNDTVYLGLREIRKAAHPRRAMVVLSDGMENHSRYSAHELLEAAVEADIQIHTIAMDSGSGTKKGLELEQARRGLALLEEIAERTGGIHVVVRSADGLQKAVAEVSEALRRQYVIGYRPEDNGQTGKWRRIQVKSEIPGVRTYARGGYYP